MRTLALSGWGQPHDALMAIAPDATHFDYTHFDSADAAIAAIAKEAQYYDRIIGWSLGGQLAVRGVAQKLFMPKQLVLMGVPFQFVKSDTLSIGMPRDVYQTFIDNYQNNPERTLKKSWELIAYDDSRANDVKAHLDRYDRKKIVDKNWHRWLIYLADYSCKGLRFEHFPPTLILHGDKDAVVRYEQAEFFARHVPYSRVETLPGCGHAPHWHDTQKIQELIRKHV